MEYPKINSVFERDERGRFTTEFACPEFVYLADRPWLWTEKVDGTNIRLYFPAGWPERDHFRGSEHEYVRGRTDNAQLPPKLLRACVDLLKVMPLEEAFPDPAAEVVLYGEGYGAGIQKGGQYRPDPGFVLFDVKVGSWWLRRSDVKDVGQKLGLDVVPLIDPTVTLNEAIELMANQAAGDTPWFTSGWPDARPEGVVGRPAVDLWDRKGHRIITKLKFRDFPRPV